LCPVESAFEFLARLRLMQPEFVFRNNHRRSDEPNSRLLLFDNGGDVVLEARGRKILQDGWRSVVTGDAASDQAQEDAEDE